MAILGLFRKDTMSTNNAINNPKIMFFAYLNATTAAVTGDGTVYAIAYDRVLYDINSGMNLGTGAYVVPKTGKYFLTCTTYLGGVAAHTSANYYMSVAGVKDWNGALINPGVVQQAGYLSLSDSAIVDLTAGQSVIVTGNVNGGAKSVTITSNGSADPRTWFCGFLID
jgi:hypothetical protein